MGFLAELWMPILLSSVFVFAASSVIHMALKYHKNDFKKLPNEDGVMDALRAFNIPPGDYHMPMCESPEAMKSPEMMEKLKRGPVALLTMLPSGPFNMGKSLSQWFLYIVLVEIFAAYLGYHTVATGTPYLGVFRVVGCAAFMGFGLAQIPNSIWYMRDWGATVRMVFDALIYGLVTAGTFGWLWPQ